MGDIARFPFVAVQNQRGEMALRPLLPVTLSYGDISVETSGLLDTGADVNCSVSDQLGLQLGGNWEQARSGIQLSGNLAQYEARGILVRCTIESLPPIHLAFAWTRAEGVPLLFGQVNFFFEFDVCFLRARGIFEVRSKTLP